MIIKKYAVFMAVIESCLYSEAYARLWALADGDRDKIPKRFIEFYKE